MQPIASTRAILSLVAGILILVSAVPAQALADAQVRFLHAVPGGPAARLQLSGEGGTTLEGVGFGQATPHSRAPARRVELALVAGGKRLARASSTFEDGARYTVIGQSAGRPQLRVVQDGKAVAARARLRLVHAAPELGTVDMKLGRRSLDEVRKGADTGYFDEEPGAYRLTAGKPAGGAALVMKPDLNLVAGTAATAYLIGSGGERTRFVVLEDAASGPGAGPSTGRGGLANEGRPWVLALMAALLTGGLSGVLYSRSSRRRSRART